MSTDHEKMMLFIEGKLNYDSINKCFVKSTNNCKKQYGIYSFLSKNDNKTIKLKNNELQIKNINYEKVYTTNIFTRSSYN